MTAKEYALPRGSRILVTGANGYIGSNIVDLLLELGFNVRGTVRTEKPWLNELFDKKYGKGRFETAIVPGMETEAAFDDALGDIAGVIHVASDVSFSPDASIVVANTIAGVRNALHAASKHPKVKRFVYTSSSVAVLLPTPNKHVVVDENTWNDAVVKAAFSEDTPAEHKPLMAYAASKTEGERETWKFIKEQKPAFTLNTVLPNMTLGRILAPEIGGSTMSWTRNFLKGDSFLMNTFPTQWWVDVQDVARLHVIALLDPAVKDERIFAFTAPFTYTEILEILRKLRPNNKSIPAAPQNEGHDLTDVKPSKRAEELIKGFFGRPGFTGLEESLAEGIAGHE